MTNSLMAKFNMAGGKSKRSFRQTNLYKLIKGMFLKLNAHLYLVFFFIRRTNSNVNFIMFSI